MQKVMILLLFFSLSVFGVEEYELFFQQYQEGSKTWLATRTFKQQGIRYYVLVDTHTFQTSIKALPSSSLAPPDERFFNSLFAKTLTLATSLHVKGGAPHALTHHPKALFLTMDMCPSRKSGYERDFLHYLTTLNGKTPLVIAITSEWINNHEEAFEELRTNPLLDITWVNHTHTHFYDRTLPDRENFMLHGSTNVKREILELEKNLIERGLTPSAFFRFPGLIADEALMKQLRQTYFLIPLGADAWIAKEESIKEGSFILVHGNKNEPQGIEMLKQKLEHLLQNYTLMPIDKAFTP